MQVTASTMSRRLRRVAVPDDSGPGLLDAQLANDDPDWVTITLRGHRRDDGRQDAPVPNATTSWINLSAVRVGRVRCAARIRSAETRRRTDLQLWQRWTRPRWHWPRRSRRPREHPVSLRRRRGKRSRFRSTEPFPDWHRGLGTTYHESGTLWMGDAPAPRSPTGRAFPPHRQRVRLRPVAVPDGGLGQSGADRPDPGPAPGRAPVAVTGGALLVAGTTSDAGKSVLTTGLCRWLPARGCRWRRSRRRTWRNNSCRHPRRRRRSAARRAPRQRRRARARVGDEPGAAQAGQATSAARSCVLGRPARRRRRAMDYPRPHEQLRERRPRRLRRPARRATTWSSARARAARPRSTCAATTRQHGPGPARRDPGRSSSATSTAAACSPRCSAPLALLDAGRPGADRPAS